MDVLSQFQDLIRPEKKQYAVIQEVLPSGRLVGKTPKNLLIALEGTANVGDAVFYNDLDKRIIGPAPKVRWLDMPV